MAASISEFAPAGMAMPQSTANCVMVAFATSAMSSTTAFRERNRRRAWASTWKKQVLSAIALQGVQVGRKAPRTRHINGMEVREKRPRGG